METKMVKFADGHPALINLCDFDPSIHFELDAAPPPAPASATVHAPAPLDSTPGPIATVNSAEAKVLIAAATTEAQLAGLAKDEKASQKHPGGRKGVLAAIAERRTELKG